MKPARLKDSKEKTEQPSSAAAVPTNPKPVPADPGYVVNAPIVVSSDSESDDEDSKSDSDDRSFADKQHYFNYKINEPPFRVKRKGEKKARGYIHLPSLQEDNSAAAAAAPAESTQKLQHLANLYSQQAFGHDEKQSAIAAKKRLAVVLGLNRRESLDPRRNSKLAVLQNASLKSAVKINRMSFFWRPYFEEKKPGSKEWKDVKFERVRQWYKQLKKHDKEKAEKFRLNEERNQLGDMVPYRALREAIKNSRLTKAAVQDVRQKTDPRKTYLALADSDVKELRTSDKGLFTHYDELITKHQQQYGVTPAVMSTGYRIKEPNAPLLELAVALDMAVRAATAKIIPNGIYYPDPNILIKVADDKTTVTESFYKSKKDKVETNESPGITSNIIAKRKLDSSKTFAFQAEGALETKTPERFKMMHVSKQVKSFNGFANQDKKILLWTQQDLANITDTSQSHLKAIQWAKSLLTALPIPSSRTIADEILHKGNIGKMLVSLLSRLFNYFNPIYIAKENLKRSGALSFENNFVKHLEVALKDYDQCVEQFVLNEHAERQKENARAWKVIDAANTLAQLQKNLSLFLPKECIERVVAAARSAGTAIKEMLAAKLCVDYDVIIQAQLHNYFCELDEEATIESDKQNNSKLHNKVLHNTLLVDKKGKPKAPILDAKEINSKGKYNLTPLHLAAATGNVPLVKYLKKHGADTHAEGLCNVLPLHLALKFCQWHGVNRELVTELLDEKNVNVPVPFFANYIPEQYAKQCGEWPITMAIKLKDPHLVSLLIRRGAELTEIYDEEGLPVAMVAGDDLIILKLVVDKGADLDEHDLGHGGALIHECIAPLMTHYSQENSVDLLKFLIAHDADLKDRDDANHTAFDLAFEGRLVWALEELVSAIFNDPEVRAKIDYDPEKQTISEDASSILASFEFFGDECLTGDGDDLDLKDEVTEIIRNITDIEIYSQNEQIEQENEEIRKHFAQGIAMYEIEYSSDDEQRVDDIHNLYAFMILSYKIKQWEVVDLYNDYFSDYNSDSNTDSDKNTDEDQGIDADDQDGDVDMQDVDATENPKLDQIEKTQQKSEPKSDQKEEVDEKAISDEKSKSAATRPSPLKRKAEVAFPENVHATNKKDEKAANKNAEPAAKKSKTKITDFFKPKSDVRPKSKVVAAKPTKTLLPSANAK